MKLRLDFPIPAKLGLRDNRSQLHWYVVQPDGKTARFENHKPDMDVLAHDETSEDLEAQDND